MPDSSGEVAIGDEELQTTDVSQEAPSTSEPEGVKSLSEAIDKALGETEATPAAAELGAEKPEQKPAEGEVKLTDPTDDELKLYPQKTQTRIRELVSLRKAAEETVTTHAKELEQLRPQAERIQALDGYLQQNKITDKDLQGSLAITAAINTGDYESALKTLTPIFQQLLQLTGRVLPQELQQEVETGYITEARAVELQRERMTRENLSRSMDQQRQDAAEKATRDESARMGNLYGSTATAWETAKKTSDPDWSMKQKLVSDLAEKELLQIKMSDPAKMPRTAQDINKMLDSILKRVEDHIRPFRPAQQAASMNTGRPASAGAIRKPDSLMDAINQALATG